MFKLNLLLLATLSACSHVDTPEAPSAPPGPQVTPPKIVTSPSPPVSKPQKGEPVTSRPSSLSFNQPQKWPDSSNYVKRGLASWYGLAEHGVKTASGEVYDLYNMTAAHATLPLHTRVRVKNLRTGKSVIVTINDRLSGSQAVTKLSYYTARRLGLLGATTPEVEIRGLKSR